MYVSLFAKAGVAVTLGPTTEPGIEGGIPAPAGVGDPLLCECVAQGSVPLLRQHRDRAAHRRHAEER